MKILVTGGAGFIGSNLVAHHLAHGDEVLAIDDLSSGRKENIQAFHANERFTFHEENLITSNILETLLAEVDRVYHMAAVVGLFNVLSNPVKTLKVNISVTERLFDIASKQSHKPLIIVASSSEVYGNRHGEIREDSTLLIENSHTSHSAYAISKLCDESIANSYFEHFGLPCIVLRIFNTIGFNQSGKYGMVVPRFVKQAVANEDITVFGDGHQKRAFCDVQDLVQLMDLIAQQPNAIGETFNIGNHQEIAVMELARTIKKLSNSQSKIKFIPFEKVYANEYIYIEERSPDISKLLNFTNYQFKWMMTDTLKELISHEFQSK